MSTIRKTQISIWSNNENLVDKYLSLASDTLDFKKNSLFHQTNYLLLHLDLESDLSELTSKLYPLLSKAEEKKIKILAVLSLSSNNQASLLDKYLAILSDLYQKKINIRILVVYDLYILDNTQPATPFDNFVSNILQTKKIDVSKSGSVLLYPVSLSQSAKAYEKLFFLHGTQSKNYYLAGTPIKDLDLAYLLNKNTSESLGFEIDINSSPINKSTAIPYQKVYETQAELNLKIEDTVENDLKQYLTQQPTRNQAVEDITIPKKTTNSFLQKVKARFKARSSETDKIDLHKWAIAKIEITILKLLLVVVAIFAFASTLFVSGSYYTLKSLESAAFNLKKGDMVKTASYHQRAKLAMSVVNTNSQIILPVVGFFYHDLSSKSVKIVNFLNFAISTFDGVTQTFVLSEKIYNSLNSPHNIDYSASVLGIKSNLQQVYESLSQIEILLDGLDLPKPIYEAIKQNAEYENLKKTKDSLWEMSKLVDVLPQVVGADKNTNIFVLVQNQNELRATSGVIEHIYHISLDKGKTVFVKSYVPQEIEGFSDMMINPPPLVEKLTGDDKWRLKDMNYNPDFAQTATNISWFLENKLKTKADFIVGMNLKVVEEILSNKDLRQSIKTDYTYEQFVADNQTGTASTKTKELVDLIINKVLNHEIPLIDLFHLLADNKGNYSLWSSDFAVQSQLVNQFISRSVNQKDCLPAISTSRKCIPQTIHVNFSNFSSIPLNGYLDREIQIIGTPQVLTVDHEINIVSRYTKQTPLINRNLTEIVQFYVTKNSVLNSISLNGTDINLAEVITQEEKDLIRYQFIISTPLSQEYTLSIKYSNQLDERTILPIAYSYNIIPQSGLKYKKQTLELNIPESSRVSAITNKIDNFPSKIVVDMSSKDSFGYNLVSK